MDPVSWGIVGAVALVTGVSTYFATRYAAENDDEQLHQKINSQIVIAQEKDNAHEFSQMLILVIILIILCFICIFWCLKCAFRTMNRNMQQQISAFQMQARNPAENANQIIV